MLRWVWAGEGWPARYQNACPRPRMPWSPPPWSPPGRRGRPRGVPPPYHCHHRPWTLPCQRHRRWTESPSSSLRLSGPHYVHRPRSRPLCNRNRRGTSPRPADRTVTKPTHQNPPPSSSSSFLFLPRHYPLKDLEWIGTTCSRLSSLFFHLVENPFEVSNQEEWTSPVYPLLHDRGFRKERLSLLSAFDKLLDKFFSTIFANSMMIDAGWTGGSFSASIRMGFNGRS